jgi:hypothetical protein
MKTLLKQIDTLTQQIENGMYTKQEAMYKIRSMKGLILDKYDEGTDNYTICIYPLLDAYNSVQSI